MSLFFPCPCAYRCSRFAFGAECSNDSNGARAARLAQTRLPSCEPFASPRQAKEFSELQVRPLPLHCSSFDSPFFLLLFFRPNLTDYATPVPYFNFRGRAVCLGSLSIESSGPTLRSPTRARDGGLTWRRGGARAGRWPFQGPAFPRCSGRPSPTPRQSRQEQVGQPPPPHNPPHPPLAP